MPLLVHCPHGCQIRVPVSRAGRVVRCPECKTAIRIAQLDVSALTGKELIPCTAKLAKKRSAEEQSTDDADMLTPKLEVTETTSQLQSRTVLPDEIDAARRESSKTHDPPIGRRIEPAGENQRVVPEEELQGLDPEIQKVVKAPLRVPPVLNSRPWRKVQPLKTVEPDGSLKPLDLEIATNKPPVTSIPLVNPAENTANTPASSLPAGSTPLPQTPIVSSPPVINLAIADSAGEIVMDRKSWQQRLRDANADRTVLARILAFFLLLVAVVNIVPAAYHWQSWAQLDDTVDMPRWIYLQVFVGAMYLIYAAFLAQIPDWSALRSVSVALLVVAFGFGVVSTGLLVGGQGTMAGLLGIPFALVRQAGIWCVAMLCLATVMSFWAGKESSNWRRAEQMLREIIQPETPH